MGSKRVLITGVTGNLGRACQGHFAALGWSSVGLSRHLCQIQHDASTGRYATEEGYDLTDPDAVRSLCHSMRAVYGEKSVDLVIMTHGVQRLAALGGLFDADNWQAVVGGNLRSAALLTDALFDRKLLAKGSLIVYCSSIQATQPRAGRGLYAIAKAGLEALARIVAVEGAPDVRAVALRLGQMDGTMQGVEFDEVTRGAIEQRTPLRWVSFFETASLIESLCNQSSMTGATLDIDSGHSLNIWP